MSNSYHKGCLSQNGIQHGYEKTFEKHPAYSPVVIPVPLFNWANSSALVSTAGADELASGAAGGGGPGGGGGGAPPLAAGALVVAADAPVAAGF